MGNENPVVIIGPGATGGLLAATLVKAGVPVALLCRNAERARRVRSTGIRVTGATDYAVPGKRFHSVTHSPRGIGPTQAVFLCVKSYDAPAAIREAKVLARYGAPVVSLLNGLAHVPLFRRSIPKLSAVYGVGYFSAFRTGPGRVQHAGGETIRLAGLPVSCRSVQTLLTMAGWKTAIAPSIERLLWTKLVLNAAINPLAALAGRPNGALVSDPALAELLGRAAAEGEAVMKAQGLEPLESPLPEFAAQLCRDTAENINSMLSDVRNGRRTELDAVLLPLLQGARRRRVPAPVLSSVYAWVRALEQGGAHG